MRCLIRLSGASIRRSRATVAWRIRAGSFARRGGPLENGVGASAPVGRDAVAEQRKETARGGKKDAEDWQTGLLRVARIRGTRGTAANVPTTVAIVARFHSAALAAHAGEALPEDADKSAAKGKKAA